MKEASEQLLTLIGDLLELTALKRGALDAVVAETSTRAIRCATRSRRPRGGASSVALDVEEPDIVPPMRSDRRTVAKALKALLDNAFKFTRDGRVRVSLQVTDDRVVYLVDDTGIGIPPDAHRVRSSTSSGRWTDDAHARIRRFGARPRARRGALPGWCTEISR